VLAALLAEHRVGGSGLFDRADDELLARPVRLGREVGRRGLAAGGVDERQAVKAVPARLDEEPARLPGETGR